MFSPEMKFRWNSMAGTLLRFLFCAYSTHVQSTADLAKPRRPGFPAKSRNVLEVFIAGSHDGRSYA
jgi:hypothetical protein